MSSIDYFETLSRLKSIYAEQNIEITVGINPFLCSNLRSAPFVQYHRDGELLTPFSGIGFDELLILGELARRLERKRIFIVGNGFGWSTIGLSMLCPEAKVVAIDPEAGIELVNDVARQHGLNCHVTKGFSPRDNIEVIAEAFDDVPDFVFIDGMHDDDAVKDDFRSLFEICATNAVYGFHDVMTFGLHDCIVGLYEELENPRMGFHVLAATSSGMTIISPERHKQAASELLDLFIPSPVAIQSLRRTGQERAFAPADLLRSNRHREANVPFERHDKHVDAGARPWRFAWQRKSKANG